MDHNTTEHGRRIVVGVDGSDCSKAALNWEITQAHLTQASVEAVAAWQDPIYDYGAGLGLASVVLADDNIQAITEKVLDETINDVAPHADVQITTRVRPGHPFAGILLGSVSQHCVQHAPCPVVVIPLPTTETHDHAPTVAASTEITDATLRGTP